MSESETHVAGFVESLAHAAGPNTVPHHIFENGRVYRSAGLSDAERDALSTVNWEDRRPKECYRNAQLEAMALIGIANVSVKYVEGYVDPGVGIGVEHAWLSVNGKVVDPTVRLKDGSRVLGLIPDGWGYYGVELDTDLVFPAALRGHWSPIIDDPANGWPLIPGKVSARKTKGRDALQESK